MKSSSNIQAAAVVASAAAAQLRIEYLLCVCVRYVLCIKSKLTRTQLKVECSLVPSMAGLASWPVLVVL